MKYTKNCFASDNYSGIAPEAWAALEQCNTGFADAYGDDDWTLRASNQIREVFDTDCEVFFAFNGTACNSLSLASMCQSYHSVLGHHLAHIETDECGAPEFFSHGTKLLTMEGENGKVQADALAKLITKRSDIHFPKPKVLSLTQSTESGTVYTADEISELAAICQHHGMNLHMDGARFANAVASLNVAPSAISWQAGVDVLSLGGTKNGMAVGDAVVFFNKELAHEFEYRCKQAGQLASKMRYISAPWVGMLQDDIWLKHAAHANAYAAQLGQRLSEIDGIELLNEVQANGVFVTLPPATTEALRAKGWTMYDFIAEGGVRLMCSWATTQAQIDDFVADVVAAA